METLPAPRAHHEFGPSRMEYIRACRAFVNRKDNDTEFSEEGTLLHDFMAEMLTAVAEREYRTTEEQLAAWVTTNYELTEEQVHLLRYCCQRCDLWIAKGPIAILVEQNIEIKFRDGKLLNHGFYDVLFIFRNKFAALLDFKFGYIPVPSAEENLQGWNYVVGAFQTHPALDEIQAEFVQPKLDRITAARFSREDSEDYFEVLAGLIAEAKSIQTNPETAQPLMHAGPYCEYCALKGDCAVLANHRAIAAAQMTNLPVPVGFQGVKIHTPEQWALAKYWADIVETGLDEVKSGAKAVAEANGGQIECTLPNGEKVVYVLKHRNVDRILGPAPEIAEVLKEYVTLEEILGAADLALGALTKIASNSLIEIRKADGTKVSKKAAVKEIEDLLTTHGLLSKPDTKISYLKLQKQVKKLTE